MKLKHIREICKTVDKLHDILYGIDFYDTALRAFKRYGDDVKITYADDECFDVDVGLMNFCIKRKGKKYKVYKYATYYSCEVSEPIELED